MQLIAQLNLWFIGPPELKEYRLNGQSMVPFEPLLGYTSSSDLSVLLQEMQWLHRYTGRDGSHFVYALEWVKPESADGLIDGNLRRTFLPAVERTRARWYLFYDPVLAARQRGITQDAPIDFAIPAVRDMFLSDLDYFGQYFAHRQYWRIRGQPVLHVWSTRTGIRNVGSAFQQALDRGIYILADVFGQSDQPIPPLSGRTGFVLATPEVTAEKRIWNLPELFPILERNFQDSGGDDLIPAISCQFDDTEFKTALGGATADQPIRILARNRQEVEDLLALAKSYARPIDGDAYVFAGTIDNWAESTTLLPTKLSDPAFWDLRGGVRRVGFYHFQHLEAVQSVLFPREPRYEGPRISVSRRGKITFDDCDLKGKLVVAGPGADVLANPPNWNTGENLRERRGFRRTWKPAWRGGVEPRKLVLRFRNLDGERTRGVLKPK